MRDRSVPRREIYKSSFTDSKGTVRKVSHCVVLQNAKSADVAARELYDALGQRDKKSRERQGG